jgi:ribosome-binding factor A
MADPQRLRRIADQIQRELAEIIRTELKDPRVGMITLTGVEVSADLAHAKVFFTSLAGEDERAATLAGLERAAGFMRSQLGARIKVHSTPQLHFRFDGSVEYGMRLSKLIDDAVAADKPPE